jgi:hypothetical protein
MKNELITNYNKNKYFDKRHNDEELVFHFENKIQTRYQELENIYNSICSLDQYETAKVIICFYK